MRNVVILCLVLLVIVNVSDDTFPNDFRGGLLKAKNICFSSEQFVLGNGTDKDKGTMQPQYVAEVGERQIAWQDIKKLLDNTRKEVAAGVSYSSQYYNEVDAKHNHWLQKVTKKINGAFAWIMGGITEKLDMYSSELIKLLG
ncbi:MAG: hypothetical protein H6Q73_1691 [Firmicutes bacterium]|nr:hypothetical protein [Bacillota bacterium]